MTKGMKKGAWAHDCPPPDPENWYGPLMGQLQELALWTDLDERHIREANKEGSMWTHRLHSCKYANWFRYRYYFEVALEKMKATQQTRFDAAIGPA
jgi:hypothetical protein